MLMYRRFTQNYKVPQMTNKGNSDNGYLMPIYHDINNASQAEMTNIKLVKNMAFSFKENLEKAMKILLIFPEISYEARNIETICGPLKIRYDVIYSEEVAMTAVSQYSYDLIIIDNRKYCNIVNINVDRFIESLKIHITKIDFKLVLYDNRPFLEFSQVLQKGFDEQWINYDNEGSSMKTHLESYLRNQFYNDGNSTNSMAYLAFQKFVDCVEILNKDFKIELVNETFLKIFKTSLMDIKGSDWFRYHDIKENKKDLIINDIKSKKMWEGFISNKNDSQMECSNYVYVLMKPMDDNENHYLVTINSLASNLTKSDQSFSMISMDRDSTITSRTRSNFLSSQQITIDSPILKIMKIISSIQEMSSPVVNIQLQNIVEILSSKDLFITTVDTLKTDKMSSTLIDGLLANNATILAQTENRRHSSSLTKRRQTRINSEVIHDHITQVLAKFTKMPEVPENEEISVIDSLLENYRNWSFNIIELERLSENKPLRYLGMKVFSQFDLGSVLNIDGKLFQNWLYVIETNYNDNNCYHNSTHAADVLQSSAWFLERDRINEIFDSYDDTISIIAAIIHDLGHPGRTNPFLINSNHSLAVLYNDIAVLENHHASFAFKVTLKDERINIFKNMNRDDYRAIRHGIIDAVLATEMAKHFEHLTKFVNNIVKLKDQSMTANADEHPNEMQFDPENKAIIRRMLIKCSDVNNPTRPFHLCKEWALRISEEYFNQFETEEDERDITDEEISRGLPVVMPQFNRETGDIPKSQIYFIDIFLRDMFTVWNEFANVEELLKNLYENKEKWKSLSEDVSSKTLSGTLKEL